MLLTAFPARSKVFLCRGRVKKQQLVVIKQIPLDELKNVERKAARNEVMTTVVMNKSLHHNPNSHKHTQA